MRLYKYLLSDHAQSFRAGAVRFQPLSYYQQHEDRLAVGDPDEAMRVFRPTAGLSVNNLTTGQSFQLAAAFVSKAVAEEVFVFCLSRRRDRALAQDFGYDSCVEITDVRGFIRRVARAATTGAHGANVVHHGPITYYRSPDPPGVAWQLPDAIVMAKRAFYGRQEEYRIAFGRREVFDIGRTAQELAFGDVQRAAEVSVGAPRVLQIGDIRRMTIVHDMRAS